MESLNQFQVIQPLHVNRKIYSKNMMSDGSSGIQCVRFDPEDRYIAAGCQDGSIRIFNLISGKLVYLLNRRRAQVSTQQQKKMPTTCLRWRPVGNSTRTKNVLISVHADGSVKHWHITSGRCLHSLYSAHNQLYCTDFSPDGTMFATAGRDLIVRIFDQTRKTPIIEFQPGGSGSPGHSNRIFSVKFYIQDPNVLLSGGWDNTIQVWDIREASAVKAIFGPHICGDALDIKNGEILAGSWRERHQLQNFLLSTGECFNTIDWDGGVGIKKSPDPCMVYACQYSKHDDGEMMLAGGSKSNEARFFETLNHNKPFAAVMDLDQPVFSVDFSHSGSVAALGCADGYIRVVSLNKTM